MAVAVEAVEDECFNLNYGIYFKIIAHFLVFMLLCFWSWLWAPKLARSKFSKNILCFVFYLYLLYTLLEFWPSFGTKPILGRYNGLSLSLFNSLSGGIASNTGGTWYRRSILWTSCYGGLKKSSFSDSSEEDICSSRSAKLV